MSHRPPTPPPPPSLGRRVWAGLASGLKVGLAMPVIGWISWSACGTTEDSRYHVISTGEDQVRQGVLFFQLAVITSGLLAAAKPVCTSRGRCALIGAGIGFTDGVATAPLLIRFSPLTGPGLLISIGLAGLGAVLGGLILWDVAQRGEAWRWPF